MGRIPIQGTTIPMYTTDVSIHYIQARNVVALMDVMVMMESLDHLVCLEIQEDVAFLVFQDPQDLLAHPMEG